MDNEVEFMLAAVNCHYDLVAALARVEFQFRGISDDRPEAASDFEAYQWMDLWNAVYEKVVAALAKIQRVSELLKATTRPP